MRQRSCAQAELDAAAAEEATERAAWVAETLAELPFEKEEEPLTLVYRVNRQARSRRGAARLGGTAETPTCPL